jgi:hypothetical protein
LVLVGPGEAGVRGASALLVVLIRSCNQIKDVLLKRDGANWG